MLLPISQICTLACILATQIQLYSASSCGCQSSPNSGNRIASNHGNAVDLEWLSDILSGSNQKTVVIFAENTNRKGVVEFDGATLQNNECPCKKNKQVPIVLQEKQYNGYDQYNTGINAHSTNFDRSNSGFNAYSVLSNPGYNVNANNLPKNTAYQPNIIVHDNSNINTYPGLVTACDSTIYIGQPSETNNIVYPTQQSHTAYYPKSSSTQSNCIVTIVPPYNDYGIQDTCFDYYDDSSSYFDCSCVDSGGYTFANYFGIN